MKVGNGKVDAERATKMLAAGFSVRGVAAAFGVSTQAVYRLINNGRIARPPINGDEAA